MAHTAVAGLGIQAVDESEPAPIEKDAKQEHPLQVQVVVAGGSSDKDKDADADAAPTPPITSHRLVRPTRSILKKARPPSSVQRLNGAIQSSLASFKRDFLGYAAPQAVNPPNPTQPGPLFSETQLNTNNNAAPSPFWKLAAISKWDGVLPQLPINSETTQSLPLNAVDSQQLSVKSIRSVRFPLTGFRVVYPLQQALPPAQESTTRDRIHEQHSALLRERASVRYWTADALLKLYALSCQIREDPPLDKILTNLGANSPDPPKTIDLSNTPLTLNAVEALADILSVDFGCKKLVLDHCQLTDESLRIVLHALLISASVATLSLANNPKVKQRGWRNLAVFARKAHFLRVLDVSDNIIDKKATDLLSQALAPPPPQLKENRQLQETNAEVQEVATDGTPHSTSRTPHRTFSLITEAPLLSDRDSATEQHSNINSLRLENCGLKSHALEGIAHGIRHSPVKHISLRRNKINEKGAVALAVMIRDYPVGADSPTLSSFAITAAPGLAAQTSTGNLSKSTSNRVLYDANLNDDAKADTPRGKARLKLRQEMDLLPTVGCLLTLDIRANDIKNGAQHIAQVLKRNRTLKVLNLAANKIDVVGLAAIADALRYNTALETLDLSHNPCCGPKIDGVIALRSAFAFNTSLLRIFLASTDFNSEGAICLAEFLPEVRSLIHLDLTENLEVDIAGVMALAVAVKLNSTLRCLDLNIPPNDPDFSRLSQDILQSCIRNTENALEEGKAKGLKQSIATPMLKSTVARNLETAERASQIQARRARAAESIEQIKTAAAQSHDLLTSLLTNIDDPSHEILRDALSQARAAQLQLSEAILAIANPATRNQAIEVNDALLKSCLAAEHVLTPPITRPNLPTPILDDVQLASPSFSITDSDDSDGDGGERKIKIKVKVDTKSINHIQPDQVQPEKVDFSPPNSPVTIQSKRYVEEEGEVFRRKSILDAQDAEEGEEEPDDRSGEELRQEILDADVPRSAVNGPIPVEIT